MSILRIHLFGRVRIVHADQKSETKITHSIQKLLGYLLLHRHRSHSREVLASLFWGDHPEERAHNCLNTALWRLRGVLEPDGVPRGTHLLVTSAGEVAFNQEADFWLDVAAFEERVARALTHPISTIEGVDAVDLEHALRLYTDDLLEGCYDNWALHERERLRSLFLDGLAHRMHYSKYHGAYEESLACGQQILRHDPLREEIHRELMRLYLANGQRVLAARQYEICRETLATELGISPMEETQLLYAQLASPTDQRQPHAGDVGRSTGHQESLRQLCAAMQAFDRAREQFQHAIRLIELLAETRRNQPGNLE